MRANEALQLAQQSIDSLKANLNQLSIRELFGLVKDLQLANQPEVFRTAHYFLMEKLSDFYEGILDLEQNAMKPEALDRLRRHIQEETGIMINPDTSPSEGLRQFISQITDIET